MGDNRITPLSIAATSERQTPKNEFGEVLARGLATGSTAVLGVASALAPGGAAVSAAISQGSAAAGSTAPRSVAAASVPGTTSASSAATPLPSDPLEAQRELMAMNQQWNVQFLMLQDQMQRESREYTAQSNILKVRHESAKNAINNIR